jgi:hypothetical protein
MACFDWQHFLPEVLFFTVSAFMLDDADADRRAFGGCSF